MANDWSAAWIQPVATGSFRVTLIHTDSTFPRLIADSSGDVRFDSFTVPVRKGYPFLTEAHIQAAKVYEEVHPRRGRPRRFADENPELSRRVTRVIKRVARA